MCQIISDPSKIPTEQSAHEAGDPVSSAGKMREKKLAASITPEAEAKSSISRRRLKASIKKIQTAPKDVPILATKQANSARTCGENDAVNSSTFSSYSV
jgi:hypothetical protein